MSARQHQTKLRPAASFTPVLVDILQRQCACGNHTMAGGECAECVKNKSSLQRKLTIGASNDPLEQEADRIADQVMDRPIPSYVNPVPPRIQRFSGHTAGQTELAPISVDRVLASSGRPLDTTLQQEMEQRFGHDFSMVRVHSGAAAEQSAQDVNAYAYAVGHNIVFGAGQYAPRTTAGRRLMGHEPAHVVQQGGHAATGGRLSIVSAAYWAGHEAQRVATAWGMDRAPKISAYRSSPKIQRQVNDQAIGSDVSPASTGRCYTCQIPGGIGICCYKSGAPVIPACFEMAKRIIDTCQGPPDSCLEQAQCAQCQCMGPQYCDCGGIV